MTTAVERGFRGPEAATKDDEKGKDALPVPMVIILPYVAPEPAEASADQGADRR